MNFSSPGQIVTVNLTLPMSVVKGAVFSSDGVTPVPFATVMGAQGVNTFFGNTDDFGRYSLLGMAAGPFTLTAQDPNSAITGSAVGTIVNVSTAVATNIVLDPSGTVTGRVLSSSGTPIANGEVLSISSGSAFTGGATADAQGNYRIERVPLGSVIVQGQDPFTGLSGAASGTLTAGGQQVAIQVTLPPTGTIRGRALRADGVTPAQNAEVVVGSLAAPGGFPAYVAFTTADSVGNYQVTGFPIGAARVVVSDPVDQTQFGFGDGNLTNVVPLTLDARFGNAVRLGVYAMNGADGFRYDVGCRGGLENGGTVDGRLTNAYAGTYQLSPSFPCMSIAAPDASGRQLTLGPPPATILSAL